MPPSELTRPTGGGPPGGPERDLPLSQADVDLLQDELARLFSTAERARAFLRNVRFPAALIPGFNDAYDFWAEIFSELGSGAMPTPYRRLITAALRLYGSNAVLNGIVERYTTASATPSAVPEQDVGEQQEGTAAPPPPTCHVVLRLNSEQERTDIETWLAAQGLAPEQMWSTLTAVSYRLNETDDNRVRQRLVTRPDLGWTLVPPGQPDYLLRQLFVEGPDGRRFRVSDIPVQSTVGSLATEVVDHYPEDMPGADRPTVADHVSPDGTGRRMNPDNTLFEEGVGENDQLRVGFQRTAAVNPLDRRDALYRVQNQLQEYVNGHPDFKITPNSALPTEYDIEFEQPSFGPPPTSGGQPTDIFMHELSIVLGPEFPITAPRVRWLSEIFHPNVFPTYECAELRQREVMRGIVCLGTLAESYQPSLDFSDLCATLLDIAAYRNYSLFARSDDLVDARTGEALLRGDFYDQDAARWASSQEGQRRIIAKGGVPVQPLERPGERLRYGYEIELDRADEPGH